MHAALFSDPRASKSSFHIEAHFPRSHNQSWKIKAPLSLLSLTRAIAGLYNLSEPAIMQKHSIESIVNAMNAHQWEHGRNEHEQMQLERYAKLPFSEKPAWLEETHRMVLQLQTVKSSCANNPSSPKR
jgi:hypothetical protein